MDRGETPATYRTSKFQRGLSLLSIGALLLLAVLEATDEGPILDLSLVKGVLTGATLLAVASYGLQATIQVSETAIQKKRPLWTDNGPSLRGRPAARRLRRSTQAQQGSERSNTRRRISR